VDTFRRTSPSRRPDAGRLRAGLDASPIPPRTLGSQFVDCDASEGMAEITEIAPPGLPDGVSGGDELAESPLTLGDFKIDTVTDPLYQAFVATGLYRPR
jgi:hypothetical protein